MPGTVWSALTDSLITPNSIGELLVANVDAMISGIPDAVWAKLLGLPAFAAVVDGLSSTDVALPMCAVHSHIVLHSTDSDLGEEAYSGCVFPQDGSGQVSLNRTAYSYDAVNEVASITFEFPESGISQSGRYAIMIDSQEAPIQSGEYYRDPDFVVCSA